MVNELMWCDTCEENVYADKNFNISLGKTTLRCDDCYGLCTEKPRMKEEIMFCVDCDEEVKTYNILHIGERYCVKCDGENMRAVESVDVAVGALPVKVNGVLIGHFDASEHSITQTPEGIVMSITPIVRNVEYDD